LDFFEGLIDGAAECGIREVAIAVNIDSPETNRNRATLEILAPRIKRSGMRLHVTTNYENIVRDGARAFTGCDSVALSVNTVLFRQCPPGVFEAMAQLRSLGIETIVNLMMTRALLLNIRPLIATFLETADQIYLFLPKGIDADFSQNELFAALTHISPLFLDPVTFGRVHLDLCFRASVFPFSQLFPYSNCGREQVCVDAEGGVAWCSFDLPFRHLEESSEFPELIRSAYANGYPQARRTCPHIRMRAN
jgi:hypothetical protein